MFIFARLMSSKYPGAHLVHVPEVCLQMAFVKQGATYQSANGMVEIAVGFFLYLINSTFSG